VNDALLTPNDQMEALSRAYVSAIAARAGYVMGEPRPDRDSVDCTLSAGGEMRPQIGAQLKATAGAPKGASAFPYALKIKNYNDLRVPTQSPRILIVLALPKSADDWLHHSVDELILRRCAFWKSLLGEPALDNTTSVTVSIDTARAFDVQTLTTLMEKSRQGVPL
jgi:hypothetical protein